MLSAADDVPPTMRAVVTTGDGHVELKRIDTPRCQSGEALVKVIAVAQNPTDCTRSYYNSPNSVGEGYLRTQGRLQCLARREETYSVAISQGLS